MLFSEKNAIAPTRSWWNKSQLKRCLSTLDEDTFEKDVLLREGKKKSENKNGSWNFMEIPGKYKQQITILATCQLHSVRSILSAWRSFEKYSELIYQH